MLLCSHFSKTCTVADDEGRIAGFVSAYRLPERPQTLFIWQVAVDPDYRGRALATRLVHAVVERFAAGEIDRMETTISPSNIPSRKLFERIASELGTDITHAPFFTEEQFGEEAHEAEELYTIGPIEAVKRV